MSGRAFNTEANEMTLFDCISKAVQSIALMIVGGSLGVLLLIMLATGFIEKVTANFHDMAQRASDGIAYEGQE